MEAGPFNGYNDENIYRPRPPYISRRNEYHQHLAGDYIPRVNDAAVRIPPVKARLLRSPKRTDVESPKASTVVISMDQVVHLAKDLYLKISGNLYTPSVYRKEYYSSVELEIQNNILRAKDILKGCLVEIDRLIIAHDIDNFGTCYLEDLDRNGTPSLQAWMDTTKKRRDIRERHNLNLLLDLKDKEVETGEHNSRIWKLEEDLKRVTKEKEILLQEKDDLMQEIAKMKSDLQNADEKIQILSQENENLSLENSWLNGTEASHAEIDELSQPELYERCIELDGRNKELKAENRKLWSTLNDDTHKRIKYQVMQANDIDKDLRIQYNKSKITIRRLEKNVTTLEKQIRWNNQQTSKEKSLHCREKRVLCTKKNNKIHETRQNIDEREVRTNFEKLKQLEQKNRQLEQKNAELDDSYKSLKKECMSIKEDLAISEKRRSDFEKNCKHLELRCNALTIKEVQLESNMNYYNVQLKKLQEENDTVRERLCDAEKENQSLTERGREDAVRLDQLGNERDKLKKRLRDAEKEKASLTQKVEEGAVRLDELTNERDKLQRRMIDADKENASLKEKGRKDDVRIDQLANENDKLQIRIYELEEKIVKQAKRVDNETEITNKLSGLKKRLRDAETEKASLTEKVEESAVRLDELTNERDKLQRRMIDADKENASLKEKGRKDDVHIDQLANENDKLQIRIYELEEKIVKQAQRVDYETESTNKLSVLNKRLRDAEKENASLTEKVKEGAVRLDELTNERDKLQRRMIDADKENASLKEKGRKDDVRIDQLANENDKLQIRIYELEENIIKQDQRVNNETESTNKLSVLNKRLVDADKDNASLKEKSRHDNVRIDQLANENDKLQSRLNDAENKNENLDKQLKQAISKYDHLAKEDNKLQSRLGEVEGQNHRLESMMKDYRDRIKTIEQEKDALLTRLSQYTSAQLVQDNPNVADLSDLNRPTKLAEKFSELYDNDWTDAFEVLTDQFGFSEEQAIQRLYEIVMVAYNYCIDTAEQQVDMLKKALTGPTTEHKTAVPSLKLDSVQLRIVQDLRKQTSQQSVESVKKGLVRHLKTAELGVPDPNQFISYIDKCAELCWYMVLPSPPLFLAPADSHGGVFDKNKYRFYQTSGKTYSYIVWPSLYLCKNGNMLAKGIAEAM